MRERGRWLACGCALWVASCAGDTAPAEVAWITDDVLAPRPERALPDAEDEPAAPTPASDARPTPGTLELALGVPAEGPPLDAVPKAEPVRGVGVREYRGLRRGRGAPLPRAHGLHVVMNAPYQSWAGAGTFVHALVLSEDLDPVPGADVYLGTELVGRTDPHGAIAFRRTPEADAEDTAGVLTFRSGELSRTVAYDAFARTSSFEGRTAYVYTDRGVYQPGQTIHARAIAWSLRGEYAPMADARVEIELLRDGRIVYGGVLETDRFGTGTLDIPLPEHAPEGRYELAAIVEDERAEADLRVERFVTPAIEIDHDLPRFVTPDVEALPYTLRLAYLAGGTFRGARLGVRLEARGRVAFELPEQRLEGAGPHALRIPEEGLARARRLARLGGRVDVVLKVTDDTGRTDEVRRMMRYERVPYRVVIELDRTQYASGDPVQANVRIVDLDAVPVRDASVDLGVGRRRLRATTDADGIGAFRFPAPAEGLELEAFVADVSEAVAERWLRVEEPLPMRSSVPETVVPEDTALEVEVSFPTGTRPAESVVHADLVDSSGAILGSFLLPIEGEVARGTLRTPSWGSVLLALWALGRRGEEVGLMTDGQNLSVTPRRSLQVTLGGLPEVAAPGAELDVELRVEDGAGRAPEGVASAALVDRGVIAMLDPLERSPVDRFYNPERKVLASTGAQTLTWPVVQRTWGQARYDVGWPSTFGWHGGAPAPVAIPPGLREARRRADEGTEHADLVELLGELGGAWTAPTDAAGLDALLGDVSGVLDGYGGGGLGLIGTGLGGGGTGEGTIGLGNLGTIGHGAGGGSGSGYGRGGGGAGRRRGGAPMRRAPPVRVVLRTNFAETGGWWPALPMADGVARFQATLPDAITEQEISVVVSDAQGGIGLGRARVPVRQALHVRSDLPPALVAGDRLEVGVAARNLTDAPARVRLTLLSDDLGVEGDAQEVEVPADGTAGATFEITAGRPGPARYRVVAETLEALPDGRRLRDEEQRTLYVRPAGHPESTLHAGIARRGRPFRHDVVLAEGVPAVLRLAVTLPTVAPALADLAALAEGMHPDGSVSAARALAAAAALDHLRRRGRDEARSAPLRAVLSRTSAALTMAQRGDGGWGRFASGESGVHATAEALEALLALERAGEHVPESVFERGAGFLEGALGSSFDTDEVAPWEGRDEALRAALRTTAFHVLAALRRDHPGIVGDVALARAAEAAEARMQRADASPLVLARGALGFLELGDMEDPVAGIRQPRDVARSAARRLERIDRLVHWEPGWFEAYGGRIEAAYATLRVLDDLDDARFETARREALRFLLSTRPAWGRWHNARSTAYAIRALLLLEPAPEGDEGTIVVLMDGEELRRVEVSSRDLYATALALREVELPARPGTRRVEVRWDGSLRARVDLRVERWNGAAATMATGPRAVGITRQLPEVVAPGAVLEARYAVDAGAEAGPLVLTQPLSPALGVERASLERLRAEERIAGFSLGPDAVRLALLGPGSVVLPMRAYRAGEVTLPAASLRSAFHSVSEATTEAARLRVVE
ncbi:MAG: MG2 domain-containing protein [Myxococcota bacterium]